MTGICAVADVNYAICSIIVLHRENTAGQDRGADCGDVAVVGAVCNQEVAVVVAADNTADVSGRAGFERDIAIVDAVCDGAAAGSVKGKRPDKAAEAETGRAGGDVDFVDAALDSYHRSCVLLADDRAEVRIGAGFAGEVYRTLGGDVLECPVAGGMTNNGAADTGAADRLIEVDGAVLDRHVVGIEDKAGAGTFTLEGQVLNSGAINIFKEPVIVIICTLKTGDGVAIAVKGSAKNGSRQKVGEMERLAFQIDVSGKCDGHAVKAFARVDELGKTRKFFGGVKLKGGVRRVEPRGVG